MHSRRDKSPSPTLILDSLISLLKCRDRLPFSNEYFNFLFHYRKGPDCGRYVFGDWLSNLDDESVLALCTRGFRVTPPVTDPADYETRSDFLLIAEMTIFEEKLRDLRLYVEDDGSIPLIESVAICAGVEYLRRKGWVVLNFISIDLAIINGLLTPAGIEARQELDDEALLRVFSWLDSVAANTVSAAHH